MSQERRDLADGATDGANDHTGSGEISSSMSSEGASLEQAVTSPTASGDNKGQIHIQTDSYGKHRRTFTGELSIIQCMSYNGYIWV